MCVVLLQRRSVSPSPSMAPVDFARGVALCSSEISPAAMVEAVVEAPQLSPRGTILAPSFVAMLLLLTGDPGQAAGPAFRETAGTRRAKTFGAEAPPGLAGVATCEASATTCGREAHAASPSRSRRRGELERELLEGPESEPSLSSGCRAGGDGLRRSLREEGALLAAFGAVARPGSTLDGKDAVLEPAGVEEPSPAAELVLLARSEGAEVEKGTPAATAGGGATATLGDAAVAAAGAGAAIVAGPPAAALPKGPRGLRPLDAAEEMLEPAVVA